MADLSGTALAEQQAKKKTVEAETAHDSALPPLSSALVSEDSSLAVATAKPVIATPTPPKKEEAAYLADCMRVRDELIELKMILGITIKKASVMEQHAKTIRGTLSRKAFSELTAGHTQDLQSIAEILIKNKSSSSVLSRLQAKISEQTMKELGELEAYVKAFPPPVSVSVTRGSSDSVALGELPPVDHSVPSSPSRLAHSESSPKLSSVETLRQDIERMKKDAIALEAAIKEGDAAVLALQEQQRKKEAEVAALKERQPKLAEELEAAEGRLPELEEAARVEVEESRKRIEEERARVEAQHKKKAEAEVDAAEDSGEDVDTSDEAETGEDEQAMLALFQQFMKAQAAAKKKAAAAKKKAAAATSHDVPRHTGSTPPPIF